MSRIRPFRALRAAPAHAATVIAPPYDVISEAEAREIIAANPHSFVRVGRPEATLPPGTDPHSPAVYAAGAAELARLEAQGLLIQDDQPGYYLYAQKMGDHEQVGLVATFAVEEYDQNLIKKHEFTRPDKERDRVEHIDAANCQSGMVFLACRDHAGLAALLADGVTRPPSWKVTTEDGVVHTLWRVAEPERVAALTAAIAELPCTYVADGHHRSAAASIVHRQRAGQPGSHAWFLAGLFPSSSLQILAYNRVVKDLFGHTAASLMASLAAHFDIVETSTPVPSGRGHFTMYLEGRWYSLAARNIPDDPVAGLDVSVLQERVLHPLLGIANPRTDKRIEFIGGIRGWQELKKLVDSGEGAVAFHLHPTEMDQLLAVADAGQVMPPKSTWFEPKLRDAVAMHRLDGP